VDNVCTARWTTIRPPRPLAARDGAGLELLQRPRRTHRPPQEDPLDGGPAVRSRRGRTRGRTTDHLGGATRRAAADDAAAPWEPDGRIVAVPPAGCAPWGRHRVPGRSRTVRAVAGPRLVGDGGTTIRGGPLGRLLRGAFLMPGAVSHSVAHMSTGPDPPNGCARHPLGRYVRFNPQKLSPACARSHDLRSRPAPDLWTPCARTGGRAGGGAGGQGREPSSGRRPTTRSTRLRGPTRLTAR
jgi:hypothetical protein